MPITRAYEQASQPGNFFVAGKNKVINGDFGIWQRGTSVTCATSTTVYTADRFYVYSVHSAGTATFSRQSFTPGEAPAAPYEGTFFGRLTCGSTTTYAEIGQKIENVRTFTNQVVTVSFWAKASVNTTLSGSLFQDFDSASGGSTGVYNNFPSTLAVTTSWQRFTVNVTLPSVSGKTILTNSNLRFQVSFTPASSQTFDIWGVQLEAGSVATPFTTATGTIQGELAACQRYYYLVVTNDSRGLIGGGQYNGATVVDALVPFPTTMRAEPTLVSTSGTNYYIFRANATDDAFDALTIMGEVTTNNGGVYTTSGVSGTSGHAGNLYTGNTAASVAFSAEL